MKTKTITLYSFDELSEKAKDKAIERLYYLNVDYEWFDSTFEDAKNIGLIIEGFDLDRNRHATGKLNNSLSECCELILKEHGKDCETYKTATDYLKQWSELVKKYSDGVDLDRVSEDNEYEFDKDADELEAEFLKSILEDYSNILQKEYEYLTSREAIIESIKANEYTFTEDGKLER